MAIILPNLNWFSVFFAGRFCSKFAAKQLFKIPTHLAYVATNINVRKQVISGKLQGKVATYSRYGGVVSNHIKKGLLLSLSVPNIHRF